MLRISLSFLLLRKCIEQKQAYIVKAVEEKRKKNTLLCCYCSAATLQYKVVFHQIVCCNFIFSLLQLWMFDLHSFSNCFGKKLGYICICYFQ